MEGRAPARPWLDGKGGLYFARAFPSRLARVTIVDRQNHHLFQPLLYQVATAGLPAPDIARPIRAILRHKPNLEVLMAEVKRVYSCFTYKRGARIIMGSASAPTGR